VLEADDSAGLLRHLSDSSLFISPVDRSHEWFRLHQLFREMLAAELRREEPVLEQELQRRASRWYEEHGDSERAIRHALSAGDTARAADLVWINTPLHQSQGRARTLMRWLEWFSHDEIVAHPALAITAAVACVDAGDGDGAREWVSIAEASPDRSPLADGSSLQGLAALVRAALGQDGVARMGRDAARASELLPDESPWTTASCYLEGVALHLAGDRDGARVRLDEGARRSGSTFAGPHALCLAQLALLAKADGDWEQAAALVRRARGLQRRHGIEDYATQAIVWATSANVLAHRGEVVAARKEAQRATGLLAQLQGEGPWMAIEARIVLARTALRLGDSVAARNLLSEAEQAFKLTPDAVVLRERLDESWEWAQSIAVQLPAGVSSLTTAELRVLQHLPTHLSFREIGERIHVSQNTVKTQALAVYRKLDVGSRSEAVDRARALGLITE
jgi:LuxR family maltose regulon positive regulatory protein